MDLKGVSFWGRATKAEADIRVERGADTLKG